MPAAPSWAEMAGSLDKLQAQIMSDNYETVLRRYMEALGASDYATIKSLFAEDGTVTSPFLGLMPARDFFDRLGGATKGNAITPIDVFLPSGDQQHAVAYFRYDWTVNDGTLITFNVMDLFEFRSGTDKVGALNLIYDTPDPADSRQQVRKLSARPALASGGRAAG